jgi:NitT/TauT family transport system substrate-binding protein
MNRTVGALLFALLLACGGGRALQLTPAAGAGAVLTKLQVGLVVSVSDAGFFIANDKGYFKDQGIELEISRFDSAARMVAFLGTGQLDLGGGAPGAGLFNAIARDIPLKIVADKGHIAPGHGFEAIIVRKDLWDKGGFKSAADLRGKKVALSSRDIVPEVDLDTFLRSGGITINDVNVVTMAFGDMQAALSNGSIDAVQAIEPFVTQIVEKGIGVIWKRNDEVVSRQQVAVVLYSPKFASYNPGLARKFVLAYLKGVRDYNDAFVKKDPAAKKEVVQILIRNTPVRDAALYDKMVMPGLDPQGRVNLDALNGQQNWFLGKGSQKTRVDLSKAVDNQYVDWAVKQLGVYK